MLLMSISMSVWLSSLSSSLFLVSLAAASMVFPCSVFSVLGVSPSVDSDSIWLWDSGDVTVLGVSFSVVFDSVWIFIIVSCCVSIFGVSVSVVSNSLLITTAVSVVLVLGVRVSVVSDSLLFSSSSVTVLGVSVSAVSDSFWHAISVSVSLGSSLLPSGRSLTSSSLPGDSLASVFSGSLFPDVSPSLLLLLSFSFFFPFFFWLDILHQLGVLCLPAGLSLPLLGSVALSVAVVGEGCYAPYRGQGSIVLVQQSVCVSICILLVK